MIFMSNRSPVSNVFTGSRVLPPVKDRIGPPPEGERVAAAETETAPACLTRSYAGEATPARHRLNRMSSTAHTAKLPRNLTCDGCGDPMPEGKLANARYCSTRCRKRAAKRRAAGKPCATAAPPTACHCGKPIPSDRRSRYCSADCRKKRKAPRTHCESCGNPMEARRSNAKYCRPACRKAQERREKKAELHRGCPS